MTAYSIPLLSGAQRFSAKFNSTQYYVTLVYCPEEQGGWMLQLADADKNPLLSSVPLRLGRDLLEQHQHLGIGHLYAYVNGLDDGEASYYDLGANLTLYYTTP